MTKYFDIETNFQGLKCSDILEYMYDKKSEVDRELEQYFHGLNFMTALGTISLLGLMWLYT
ncbi:CLUMA_CG003359, isoform A [Clunio marinus]|uniref:CLUMA_CG003359, isoform A n=1 Tax=Clunio marinus TaxID=568069 RepID=A0A1J1HQ80_9DIPT|nr:CLUMA_CG003359, isoform A [Clunio marinus]